MEKVSRPFILPLLVLAVAAFLRFNQLYSFPAGLHYDEASNGIDALEVISTGNYPFYFERNKGGREPLFIYLVTASVYVFGNTTFAIRLVPAFIGLLTVAGTYALTRVLFNRRIAIIAMALIAVSDWHLHFSRTSLRAISFPFFEILTFLLLWKGLSTGRIRYFAWSGVAAGLSMYTYYSSRLFPILLALLIGYLAVFHRKRVSWQGVILFAGVSSLLFAPLGYYYLIHQDVFFARMEQVSALSVDPSSGQSVTLEAAVIGALGMFSHLGDVNWEYNLPGKPVFDQLTFALFALGLGLSVYRWRRHPASFLVVVWLVVMIVPTALSIDNPNFLRALGIVPAVFILPAIAVDALWPKAAAFLAGRHMTFSWLLPSAVGAWLSVVGATTFHDYFLRWGPSLDAYVNYSTDMVEASRYLNTLPDGESVFLSSGRYQDPPVLFTLRRSLDLRWFSGSQSLVFPDYDREVVYVFPYTSMPVNLDEFFPAEGRTFERVGPQGVPALVAYRARPQDLSQAALAKMPQPVQDKVFGEAVEVLGYRLGKEVKPGGTLPLDILWRVRQRPSQDLNLAFFSHLIDQNGQGWGVGDANGYPNFEWTPGDLVLGRYDVRVRPDTPPGRYFVEMGLYDRLTGDRLLLSEGNQPDHLVLDTAKILQAGPLPRIENPLPSPALLAGGVNLLGYGLSNGDGNRIRQGQDLRVRLLWQATARLSEDYTVFVHLLDDKGRLVAQHDSQPAGNRFPTSFWDANELIADEHQLTVGPSLPPGDYTIQVGMYLLATGQRLGVLQDGKPASDSVTLTGLKIEIRP